MANDLPTPLFSPLWSGVLDGSDSNNVARPGRFFDDFLLEGVSAGEQVQISLNSNSDPYLQLIDVDTGAIIAFNDDFGLTLNSRLLFTVEPGTDYIVRATTFAANTQGEYTIATSSGGLTPATPLVPNQVVKGNLSLTDFQNPNREGSVYDGYLLTNVEPGEFVVINVFSDFDNLVQVIDANTGAILAEDDDSGLGLNALLSFNVEEDVDYLIQVTSFGSSITGGYSLSIQSVLPEDQDDLLFELDPYLGNSTAPSILNTPINGVGNNLLLPSFGAAGSALRDSVPLDYSNGFSSPAGVNRPNTRVISNAIAQQMENVPDPRGLTNLIWAWGQFLDHDITLTPDTSPSDDLVQEITIPEDDPVLDSTNVISLRESEFIEGTGTGPENPRQLPNEITHWVDGSNVYGSSEAQANRLRAFTGGLLLTGEGNLLPITFSDNGQASFVAGDVRASENSVLTSMHTLFVREHNRLATLLAEAHPDWTDEQLYQRARQINIAQIQNITFNEYLPSLGIELPDYTDYDPLVNPNIDRVFSTAAFRLGHTQLSSVIPQLDVDGAPSGGNLLLRDVFFPGIELLQNEGIEGILRGVASSLSQRVDNQVIEDVRSLLFGEGPNSPARDLAAINIERGRLNGLADYNTVRESYGLSRITSFAEITSNSELQVILEDLYGTVDNIDTFVGLLAEDLEPGSSVGETVAVILRDQFTRLRNGDRFYFENTLLAEEAALISQTTLSDIIRRNTDTTVIQDNAFTLTNVGSDLADVLNGGLGEDLILANAGDDIIRGYAAGDDLFGAGGNDILHGGSGRDNLFGDQGNDQLIGDGGSDILTAGSGADTLIGTNGSVRGVGERDVLTGGAGQDLFILGDTYTAYYVDNHPSQFLLTDLAFITDFNPEQDVIQLHGSVNQYELDQFSTGYGLADVRIFYRSGDSTAPELIAILENVPTSIDLTFNSFSFV